MVAEKILVMLPGLALQLAGINLAQTRVKNNLFTIN